MTQPVTQPVNLIHTLLISPWNQNDHHCIRYSICWMPVAESNYETTTHISRVEKLFKPTSDRLLRTFFCLRRFFFSAFGQLPGCWGNLNNPFAVMKYDELPGFFCAAWAISAHCHRNLLLEVCCVFLSPSNILIRPDQGKLVSVNGMQWLSRILLVRISATFWKTVP